MLHCVASFAEAWIEILSKSMIVFSWAVASFAEAWIEILLGMLDLNQRIVASFAEAWIEISKHTVGTCFSPVASFAEAWIEIISLNLSLLYNKSPPSRRRGLKYCLCLMLKHQLRVASFAEAWIEIFNAQSKQLKQSRRLLRGGVD